MILLTQPLPKLPPKQFLNRLSHHLSAVSGGIDRVVKTRWVITNYIEGRTEVWSMNGCDPTPITAAYTFADEYIGDLRFAKYLAGMCIRPELRTVDSNVCSVGYSAVDLKWYGWSHRALCGFTLGDKLFDEHYGEDDTLFTEHGQTTITTMDEAREAAAAFAAFVS